MKTQKDYRKQITALILAILTVFTAFVVTSCGKQQNNLSVSPGKTEAAPNRHSWSCWV